MPLALVRASLQLPYSILYPTFDSRCEPVSKTTEENEKFKEGDIDDAHEEGEGDYEGEGEDIDISGRMLAYEQIQGGLTTYTTFPLTLIFCAPHSVFTSSGIARYLLSPIKTGLSIIPTATSDIKT